MDADRVTLREISDLQHRELASVLDRVRDEYRARTVLLVENCGRPLAVSGIADDRDLDALASLAASTVAAAQQLALTLGEPDLTVALQSGCQDRLHLVLTGPAVLAVLMAADSPEGLPRLRARLRRSRALTQIQSILARSETVSPPRPLPADLDAAEIDAALDGLTARPSRP
ncbi:MAG TPA: roadblock/LC7 domain-containing protein [Deferrisomatales bacterium]|nr:roadblock/LC7 domain-containing protein [Deferrisomatales bacterium]